MAELQSQLLDRPAIVTPEDTTIHTPYTYVEPGSFYLESMYNPSIQYAGFILQNTQRRYASQDGVAIDVGSQTDTLWIVDGHGGEKARNDAVQRLPFWYRTLFYKQTPDEQGNPFLAFQEAHSQTHLENEMGITEDGAVYAGVHIIPVEGSNRVRFNGIVPGDCELYFVRGGKANRPISPAKHLDQPAVRAAVEAAGSRVVKRHRDTERATDIHGRPVLAVANAIGDVTVPGVGGRNLSTMDLGMIEGQRGDIVVGFSDGLRNNLEHGDNEGSVDFLLSLVGYAPEFFAVAQDENALKAHLAVLQIPIGQQELILELNNTLKEQEDFPTNDLAYAAEMCKAYIAKVTQGRYNDDLTFVLARVKKHPEQTSPLKPHKGFLHFGK